MTNHQFKTPFEQQRTDAEADGTSLRERDDFPPADLFHAAQALHTAFTDSGNSDLLVEIDAPADSALWGALDVDRAAALLRERDPEVFAPLAARFSWLSEAADGQTGTGAIGTIADQF